MVNESAALEVSVIIPARNEEAALAACLGSLASQQGTDFEIMVVDDASTDRTAEIARSFADVRLIAAPALPEGWSGKSHACWVGAGQARGRWLLFTDADTVHLPGSLARALAEARQHSADLLSYSPAQETHSFWERAVLPVIFAELASTYRPAEVSDPASPMAAANGQYLLIARDTYFDPAVGGHAAVRATLLEDVALARRVKRSGRRLRFRFGGDAVRTRMYRSFQALREGWTKNLALLFPNARRLAAVRAAEFALIVGAGCASVLALALGRPCFFPLFILPFAFFLLHFLWRIRRAHFAWTANLAALLGLPFFSYLLLRSAIYYSSAREIAWKGRRYPAASGGKEPRP